MALSGSFYTNVGSHWRLQLEWSATQSISGNYSDVTARLYWMATSSYGAVNSSATKTASITIDGSSNNRSASGLAKLSGNQKKQIHSYTKRVNHNSDGTKSFSISAWFDAQVTLSGTYYNRISLSSRSFTLNTIPRASSITSTANWTAPNSKSVTISRASTSFTHTVQWQVKNKSGSWVNIKTVTGVGTSTSGSFTTSENTLIYQTLDGRSNAESRIVLTTYSGSTKIGNTVYKTGTVKASAPSTLTYANNFNIGQNATFSIWRQNSSFKHTLKISFGSWSKTIASNFDTSTSWNTSNDASNLYSQIPNDNGGYGTYELTTYYNGVKVQYSRSYKVYLNVVNSNPSFDDSFIYRDINSTTSNITGNDQYIIQGKSNVRVTIPVANRATPKNSATMVRYEATLNGVTKSANWSSTADVNIDFGTVDASSNISLTIKAIDSRGNSTSASKTVTMIPYSSPTVNTTASRLNNFENQTTITLKGSASPLSIGGANKNSIVTARYRYKNSKNSIYGSWSNFYVSGFPNYTATNVNLNLNNLESWDIQVEISDKLSTVTRTIKVPIGKPIFFIDAEKHSIGFNDFPSGENEFRFNGEAVFGGYEYANNAPSGNGTISILSSGKSLRFEYPDGTHSYLEWMNDKGAREAYVGFGNDNAEYFAIRNQRRGASGWITLGDHALRLTEDTATYDGRPIFTNRTRPLWSGEVFLQETQTVYPEIPIKDCPNGWLLVWSTYANGQSLNSSWSFTYVHKLFREDLNTSGGLEIVMMEGSVLMRKYIYVRDDRIEGHETNRTSPNTRKVLRRVYAF